jgi:beta-phosphoglucomutase-like phosphatase (HAD superfamily)
MILFEEEAVMQINGVIFDFNGTLFFDTPYHVDAFDRLSMELTGKHVTLEIMESEFAGMPNVEIFRNMTQGRLSDEECQAYSQRKEELYRAAVRADGDRAALAPGAVELFEYLKKRNIPFTIASASIRENIDFFIEIFHLDKWIEPEKIVYDDGSYKNKIQMFKDAAAKIGVSDHLLIFEDSLSGIRCSHEIGAGVIVIDREVLRKYYDDYADIIAKIDDFRGIEKILEA